MQLVPHAVASVLDGHALSQRWKPELHEKSHAPLTHVGAALVTCGHTVQFVPHAVGSLFDGHAPLHKW